MKNRYIYIYLKFLSHVTPFKGLRQIIKAQCECIKNGNKIIIFDEHGEKITNTPPKNLTIVFNKSKNCTIKIHKKAKFRDCTILFTSSNDSSAIFEKSPQIKDLFVQFKLGKNQHFYWGENSTTWGCSAYLNENNSTVKVGKNCMFSTDVTIWATDGHTILDKNTKEILNKFKDQITIGNNCWIGHKSSILKNARIPNNTIVAFGSIVTKKFNEEYTILAGSPAKVIKENVTWDRKTPTEYEFQTSSI